MNIDLKSTLKKFVQGKNSPYIEIMFFSLLCFIVLAVAVVFSFKPVVSLDKLFSTNFNTFALEHPHDPMIFITNLGSTNWVLPVAFLLILGFSMRKRIREAIFIFMAIGGAGFLTVTLKELIGRSRPVLNSPLTHVDWYGFPSGHATLATCFYGALIYLAFTCIKDRWLKISVVAFLSLLILIIGISRVYLGAHFPTDVLAGFSIGIFWTALCALVYKKAGNL